MIEEIRKILEDENLKIEIFCDEVIFNLWDIEFPIVVDRASGKVIFKSEYLDNRPNMSTNLNLEDMEIALKVMRIIEKHKGTIRNW